MDRMELEPDEVAELSRMACCGDIAARDRIVDLKAAMVVGIALRMKPPSMDVRDVVQEGFLAAYEFAGRCPFEPGRPFENYMAKWVKGRIRHAIHSQGSIIRVPATARRRMRKWNAVARTISERWGSRPCDEDVAAEMGISERPGRGGFYAWKYIRRSLACKVDLAGGIPIEAVDRGESTLDRMVSGEDMARLRAALSGMGEPEMRLIGMKYGIGRPATPIGGIAEELGVTRNVARRLIRDAESKLRSLVA